MSGANTGSVLARFGDNIWEKPSTPLNGISSTSVMELYNFGPNIRMWISILYNNVESGVMNAGFMTNYFKVSRGVRQGCPLSPLLFVLAVEMLALKIRQDQLCRGIELPNGQNAKISQFADDTTLILEDTTSLRNAMNIVNSFGVLSGLQLNKKKTKAL